MGIFFRHDHEDTDREQEGLSSHQQDEVLTTESVLHAGWDKEVSPDWVDLPAQKTAEVHWYDAVDPADLAHGRRTDQVTDDQAEGPYDPGNPADPAVPYDPANTAALVDPAAADLVDPSTSDADAPLVPYRPGNLVTNDKPSTALDYLDWRGDLSFDTDPLNEVDCLIFSIIAYLDYSKIWTGQPISLGDLRDTYFATTRIDERGFSCIRQYNDVLYKVGLVPRFSNVTIVDHAVNHDADVSEQFAALCFALPDGSYVASFSGTDDSLTGWKENLMMSVQDTVPAQHSAQRWLSSLLDRLPGHYICVGHSKGGNLAVYAACHQSEEELAQIDLVYNFDGPGFSKAVYAEMDNPLFHSRRINILPESSVVGMLLEHDDSYDVIRSTQTGLMEHDALSWCVLGTRFVRVENRSQFSHLFNQTFINWLGSLSLDERKRFIEALFSILESSGAKTVMDLTESYGRTALRFIHSYINLSSESRQVLKTAFYRLFRSGILAMQQGGRPLTEADWAEADEPLEF